MKYLFSVLWLKAGISGVSLSMIAPAAAASICPAMTENAPKECTPRALEQKQIGETHDNQANQFRRLAQSTGTAKKAKQAGPSKPKYMGCWKDFPRRVLPRFVGQLGSNDRCIRKCRANGYTFAGSQYGGECFCGNSLKRSKKLPESRCRKKCRRDRSQTCGGTWASSIYRLK